MIPFHNKQVSISSIKKSLQSRENPQTIYSIVSLTDFNDKLNVLYGNRTLVNSKSNVIIVQECENLREDYFSGRKFFWTGRIQKKAVINNTSRSKSKKRLTVSRFFDSSD